MQLAKPAFARPAFRLIFSAWLAVFLLGPTALAQEAFNRPARAEEAADALRQAIWRDLEPGLAVKQASTALGTALTVLRISAADFKLSIEQQKKKTGERAQSAMKRMDATVVINGGFFGERADGELYPVGRLVDDGQVLSKPWSQTGGYLTVDSEGSANIQPSRDALSSEVVETVQTKPVLIEPGGAWAMRTNGSELEWRTLFCVLENRDYLVMVVSGSGLTLFEAGWLFRSPKWGGVFGCDSAIALDGGGSTQLSVKGQKDLKVTGLTGVQNLIAFVRR